MTNVERLKVKPALKVNADPKPASKPQSRAKVVNGEDGDWETF